MISRPSSRSWIALALITVVAVTAWPSEAHAQRRGGGRGGRVVVVSPRYAGFGFYDPFFWGGWGPMWGGGWYPPFGGYGGRAFASARLKVTPKQAEVYVDGYLAGSVDDFDGVFQRLDLEPGEHELTLYLDGYRPVVERRYFQPGTTIDIRQQLAPLASGEPMPPRPVAMTLTAGMSGAPDESAAPVDPQSMPRRRGPWGRSEPAGPTAPSVDGYGTLAIRVQPADATLVVDGEEWAAPDGDGPIRIELTEGPHEIEVRKEGATTYQRTVEVRAGRTVSLNVSLSR